MKEPLMLLRHNISDKHRLTNKFDGWVQAVRYQNHKYKDLIADLPEQYKWDRKLMIYIDAAKRCENAGPETSAFLSEEDCGNDTSED